MAVRLVMLLLLSLAPLRAALAHSWYDPRCCTERDCRRATKVEVLQNGDRIVTADNGMVVEVKAGFTTIHPSHDSDTHICYYLTWRGEPRPRCLYIPGSS